MKKSSRETLSQLDSGSLEVNRPTDTRFGDEKLFTTEAQSQRENGFLFFRCGSVPSW